MKMKFLHSSYDISKVNFAKTLFKKNVMMAVGSFIFDAMVLVQNEGYIEGMNCYFKSYYDNNVRKITFTFGNDHSLQYTHH